MSLSVPASRHLPSPVLSPGGPRAPLSLLEKQLQLKSLLKYYYFTVTFKKKFLPPESV